MAATVWLISTAVFVAWAWFLWHCLTTDRLEGSERIAWAVALFFAWPVTIPAYLFFVLQRPRAATTHSGNG
jgi:Phospholipase_D-nuclease N-terminal